MHNQLVDAVAVEVGARQSGDAGAARVACCFAGPRVRNLKGFPVEDATSNLLVSNLGFFVFQHFEIVNADRFGGAGCHHLWLAKGVACRVCNAVLLLR